MLDAIAQGGITVFGLLAITLVARKNKWGFVFGCLAQPFWFFTAYVNEQWGIFFISVAYAGIWMYGVWKWFFRSAPQRVHSHASRRRKPARIEKRTWPQFFEEVFSGEKTFELRLADFSCQPGDVLVLREWNPALFLYTGREIEKTVSYVLRTQDAAFWSSEDIERYGLQVIGFR